MLRPTQQIPLHNNVLIQLSAPPTHVTLGFGEVGDLQAYKQSLSGNGLFSARKTVT